MPPDSYRMRLKLWGVRGSTPTPGPNYLQYGGNTTCFEILSGDGTRIIVDAGSGIRQLGLKMIEERPAHDLHLFLTHFHWDHIQGIPFFAPLLRSGSKVTFHSFPTESEIKARLQVQMSSPYFTLGFEDVGAAREFSCIEQTLACGSLQLTPFPLNHPQGACGYRIECRGASIVIATDFEHGNPALDKTLRDHAEGADLIIYDAQYTPAEYETRRGWGHSTYQEAATVARDANVKRLILFHHDPTHDDARMTEIATVALTQFENTTVARELDCITL